MNGLESGNESVVFGDRKSWFLSLMVGIVVGALTPLITALAIALALR